MKNEDINSESAKQLRERLALTQKEFWGPVGVQQSVASRYERGAKIPLAVRLMIVSAYCGGKPVAVPHASAVKKARVALEAAAKQISEAHAALASI